MINKIIDLIEEYEKEVNKQDVSSLLGEEPYHDVHDDDDEYPESSEDDDIDMITGLPKGKKEEKSEPEEIQDFLKEKPKKNYSDYSQAELNLLLNDAIDKEDWKKAGDIGKYIIEPKKKNENLTIKKFNEFSLTESSTLTKTLRKLVGLVIRGHQKNIRNKLKIYQIIHYYYGLSQKKHRYQIHLLIFKKN